MKNEENESANIKANNPLTPQQDNRIFESIPVRPAPWSKQPEAGRAMNKERALNMFRTANQWLYDRLAEDSTCSCGNCYLCAYNFLASPSDSARRAAEAQNRDKAQEIILATEAALEEKFDSIARHELVNRITAALDAAAPADNDAKEPDTEA